MLGRTDFGLTWHHSGMHYTWWITRPKRSLAPVPLVLAAMTKGAGGMNWDDRRTETGLAVEAMLESAGLKREGDRRDQGAGGARTYRAWLKSLGLVFMRKGTMHLTWAGQGLVEGEAPLPILTKQVITYQFPSAFTANGASAVSSSFKVRPFVLLLQLLRDPRLEGSLVEKDEVAKIAVCYGTSNAQSTVDDLVGRILSFRRSGDSSLDPDYLERFRSTRAKEDSLDKLFGNLNDIANTAGNWLGYTQLISRIGGVWEIVSGAEDEIDSLIRKALDTPLIKDWDNEEKYQRRYGLKPGQSKDTRSLTDAQSVTGTSLEVRSIEIAFQALAATRLIDSINPEVVQEISDGTGAKLARVDWVLAKKYPSGAVDGFMNSYAQMAFESREKATEFEKATTSIFRDVFGFDAKHIGAHGGRPDVVISSRESEYGAILDSKAYKKGYSLLVGQRNRMRDYISDFSDYALDANPLAFFAYVVSEYKANVEAQLRYVAEENGVNGSAITARDIIRMVRRHREKPYSHDEIREIFSANRPVIITDLKELSEGTFT